MKNNLLDRHSKNDTSKKSYLHISVMSIFADIVLIEHKLLVMTQIQTQNLKVHMHID